MKVTYKTKTKIDQDDNITSKIDTKAESEKSNEELSDKFLYGYLIVCTVIIIALKIFT